MTNLLEKIHNLPSYSLECHGYQGDEMIKQKPLGLEYLQKYNDVAGDWFSAQDILNLLKEHGLI